MKSNLIKKDTNNLIINNFKNDNNIFKKVGCINIELNLNNFNIVNSDSFFKIH